MADIINVKTLEYLKSVHTQDYLEKDEDYDFSLNYLTRNKKYVINPVMPECKNEYMKIDENKVCEMTDIEKEDVDNNELSIMKDVKRQELKTNCENDFVKKMIGSDDDIDRIRNGIKTYRQNKETEITNAQTVKDLANIVVEVV